MKTRNTLIILALASVCGLVVMLLGHPRARVAQSPTQPLGNVSPAPESRTNQDGPVRNVPAFSQRLLREVPNAVQRFTRLERLGQVPQDADLWDWSLAQKTSWWGRRLDPKTFWKDRTLWLDASAWQAARRHGRQYPPIPYDDPRFASRSDVDRSSMPSADSPGVCCLRSDKENAFWDDFAKKHPQPPEYIASEQALLAERILGRHYRFNHGTGSSLMTEGGLEAMDGGVRGRAQALGFPPEAFTDEALHWRYVLEKRAEYEQQYVRTRAENTLRSSNFLARVWVDPKLITEPLTDAQLKAADAWEIAYLQRLHREQADESYINAYLQAWNLSGTEVFGTTNGP